MADHLYELLLPTINKMLDEVRKIVREELANKDKKELATKLLSPAEARKLFSPPVSVSTLNNWEKQGLLNKHYIGRKTYYRHDEILEAAKKLVRYKTKHHF